MDAIRVGATSRQDCFLHLFRALLSGTGTAWVDAMKIELDGVPYRPFQIDLDFESPTARGFIVGCGSSAICTGYKYKVGIDDTGIEHA